MLHYAQDCGGDKGKHYAACVICACNEIGEDQLILPCPQSGATTGLSHLLFVCMCHHLYLPRQHGRTQLRIWTKAQTKSAKSYLQPMYVFVHFFFSLMMRVVKTL